MSHDKQNIIFGLMKFAKFIFHLKKISGKNNCK